jgi:hypothetical protein
MLTANMMKKTAAIILDSLADTPCRETVHVSTSKLDLDSVHVDEARRERRHEHV